VGGAVVAAERGNLLLDLPLNQADEIQRRIGIVEGTRISPVSEAT
jgi:hypothetical protein